MVPPTVKPGMDAETQRFRPDALAGKRRVSVNEYRQHLGLPGLSQARLPCAGTAHGHRIHRFQVTGIRYQMQAYRFRRSG